MPRYVIDTNVPIVANGEDEAITHDCRKAAVTLLMKAIEKGKVFLDSEGAIQDEYRRYLNPKGQPGVGDRFFLEVINSHPNKVARVDLQKRADGEYLDLPQAIIDSGFDPSDRKFAAVAKKSGAKVYNAVDSDWVERRTVIEANGIEIVFLCGCDPAQWRRPEEVDL
ncbi:PIN domain-containing protein [Leisingera caerulea]|uniref:PIN domain-containing protein n=1 Tax=Leisingera caerulea TaxID=506591 RepID=UPI0021A77A02|nr:PIN domain-containing protein [Leisingera caerulea]UWQ50648.1 PIN domain-containing protein [Leisingera caerulea]